MSAIKRILVERMRLIYQGGHHDVYCDGKTHVWVCGDGRGTVGFRDANKRLQLRVGGCDCENWRKP